ncbi:hypothetical protein FORC58_4206 [Salmonella enterica subsp. enterica serovar Typhimurium]|nr:hypothetical protein FORC58_4206 [Salmonella enterica subsp. enterica serovar Typhimurium]
MSANAGAGFILFSLSECSFFINYDQRIKQSE